MKKLWFSARLRKLAGRCPLLAIERRPPVHMLTVATWNINSVRLRMPLIERFMDAFAPDVLCLQETKCANGQFPSEALEKLGLKHQAINGQKGYHGVAIASRLPLADIGKREFCGKGDARHVSATVTGQGGRPITIHNFYVPAGGDIPDPSANDKFAHKLAFLDEMEDWFTAHPETSDTRMMLVGDLNVAPLENDVWSHKQLLKVVSHTPVETQKLSCVQASHEWIDVMREHIPAEEKLYTWWSYRARDWAASDRGRRLDHIWVSPSLAGAATSCQVVREVRGWERPSDHAPVIAELAL